MIAFALLVTALGVAVAATSATALGFGTLAEPGPGFFPCAVGAVLAMAGARTAAGAWLAARRSAGAAAEPLSRESRVRLVLMVATLAGWLVVLPAVGYVGATFAAVLAMSKTMGLRGRLGPVALAAGAAGALFLLFDLLFYVDLPRGLPGR